MASMAERKSGTEYCWRCRGMVPVAETGNTITNGCSLCGAETVEPGEKSPRREMKVMRPAPRLAWPQAVTWHVAS